MHLMTPNYINVMYSDNTRAVIFLIKLFFVLLTLFTRPAPGQVISVMKELSFTIRSKF